MATGEPGLEAAGAFFDEAPAALVAVDPESGGVLAVNRAAVRLCGFSPPEFRHLTLADLVEGGDWRAVAAPAGGDMTPTLARLRLKGQATLDADVATVPVTAGGRQWLLLSLQDASPRLRLEADLRQAQKMEAVGRLAGGVAHDFNNLLTAIIGYADMLQAGLADGTPGRRYADQVLKAGKRAAALTQRLLAFSRKQAARPEVVKLNAVVSDMQPMLARLVGAAIEISSDLAPDLGLVLADPHQIEQVLLNLVVNARDAMPEGGRISIRTANAGQDAPAPDGAASVGPQAVLLSVTDTGCGMTDEVKAHVFEPFFTTKESGKGTGLGLSTVAHIVREAGGAIAVASALGAGTTMTIRLPRAADSQSDLAADAAPAPRRAAANSPRPRVLVVDPDEGVLELTATVLALAGCDVTTASTTQAASRAAEGASAAFDVLLVDVATAGSGRRSLLRWIEALYPALAVVSMSQHDGDDTPGDPDGEGVRRLQKPFTPAELLEAVRAACPRCSAQAVSGVADYSS